VARFARKGRFTAGIAGGPRLAFVRIFKPLAAYADNESAMIESAIVPAHQQDAGAQKAGRGEAIGRSPTGVSTKTMLLSRWAIPHWFQLTPAQAHGLEGRRRIAATNGDRYLAGR
jgi:hypothetical protein